MLRPSSPPLLLSRLRGLGIALVLGVALVWAPRPAVAGAFWDRVATEQVTKITTPALDYVLHGDVSRRIGFLRIFVKNNLRERASGGTR